LAVLVWAAATFTACDYSYLQPTGPSSVNDSTTGQTGLTYVTDIRPVLNSDCVRCHGPSRRDAGVDLSTYNNVMRTVVPGNQNSRLILVTRRGGLMYGEFNGNASQKAALIHDWITLNNAAEQ